MKEAYDCGAYHRCNNWGDTMGFLMPKPPKGPDPVALQQAAADRESQRAAAEKAKKEQQALSDMEAAESKRRAFAGSLTETTEDEDMRRKFLKGM
jgi:hypothetical protein